MSTPVWAPSPWRDDWKTRKVALLEVTVTGNHLVVKDSEIGEVYLDTYVYSPDIFSLKVSFNANGVKSIGAVKE